MSFRIIGSGLVACLLAGFSIMVIPSRESVSLRASFSPQLIEPSGADAVGVRRTALDTGNDDPWNPGHSRTVMVSVHYPAAGQEHPLAHYAMSSYMDELAMLAWAPHHEQRLGLNEGDVNWLFRTHSHQWAPPRPGRYPVVLVSAPPGGMRTSYTTLAEDLASHGIIVVTVDHPYDAPVVELWPTREVIEADEAAREPTGLEIAAARAADLAAVADRVSVLDAEIGKVMEPGCTVPASELSDHLAALTDEPVIGAQISERHPSAAKALGPLPTPETANRDLRIGSAEVREALASWPAGRPNRQNCDVQP